MKCILLALFELSAVVGFAQQDSITYIKPDDYPITTDMLRHEDWPKQQGIIAVEKVFFRSVDTAQVLIIELATDYHRYHIFHLQTDNIPDDVLNDIYMNYLNGEIVASADVKRLMPAFINQAKAIDAKYFKSKKGVQLGISTVEAIKLYGNPDTLIHNDIDKYIWIYSGDITPDILPTNKKVRAKNSFGYKVEMYFKDDKLIAHVLTNEIP